VRPLLATSLLSLALAGCSVAHSASPSPSPASTGPGLAPAVRYLALGDSFTIGTGTTPERSFPARLVSRASCGVELRNVAVNGYATDDVLDEEVPALAAFAPTFVTLAIGANDIVRGSSPVEYRARVRRILAAVRAAGSPRLVTIPQPDWSLSPAAQGFGEPSAIHARIVEANAILRDETAAAGGTYVDLFDLMESQAWAGQLARDELHPSAEAYDAWAAELARRAGPC
jgi:acyl-CoA thioesterase-1